MRRRLSTPRGRGALVEQARLREAAPCPPPRQRPGRRCPGRAPLMPGAVPRRGGCGGRSCPLAGGLRGPAWPGPAHSRRLRRAARCRAAPARAASRRSVRAWGGPAARPGAPRPAAREGRGGRPGAARGEGVAELAVPRRTPALKSCRVSEGKSCVVVGAFRAWGRFWVFLAVRKPPVAGRCPRVPPADAGGSSRVAPAGCPALTHTRRPLPPGRSPVRASSVSACPADTPSHRHPLSSRRCCFQIHTLWRAERVLARQ